MEPLFKIILFLQLETLKCSSLLIKVHCNYAKQKTYSRKSNANLVCL